MSLLVCSLKNRECMLQRCENCPDPNHLKNHIISEWFKELDEDEEITYQQWQTTDRCNLVTMTTSIEEYIDYLVSKLEKLTSHSYLTTTQAEYLRKCKENLRDESVIFLGDFAENYKFVVQDEVQGFHWNTQQITLHPVVIYFREHNEIKSKSFCFLSDDMEHDVSMVYKIQQTMTTFIREWLPDVQQIQYFSDGCAGQYKNKSNFFNLCKHEEDFGLKASWTFFATSHGKSPCDGIGGTVKRVTAKTSLHRPLKDQILDCSKMFQFCEYTGKFPNIKFFFISTGEMKELRVSLKKRFEGLTTIPGTRSYHHFEPVDNITIAAKRASDQEHHSYIHNFPNHKHSNSYIQYDIASSSYVACVYDQKWWIGLVENVNHDMQDAEIIFLHPSGPARSFSFPRREDKCLVPLAHILC